MLGARTFAIAPGPFTLGRCCCCCTDDTRGCEACERGGVAARPLLRDRLFPILTNPDRKNKTPLP